MAHTEGSNYATLIATIKVTDRSFERYRHLYARVDTS